MPFRFQMQAGIHRRQLTYITIADAMVNKSLARRPRHLRIQRGAGTGGSDLPGKLQKYRVP